MKGVLPVVANLPGPHALHDLLALKAEEMYPDLHLSHRIEPIVLV